MASIINVDKVRATGSTTDGLLVDSSGRVTQPALPVFFANGNASGWQNFATSNTVIADWATSGSNYISQGGFSFSSGTITVPVAGVYEVTGSILVEADNSEYGLLMIYHGSTRITASQIYNVSAGGQIQHTTTTHAFVDCAASDTIGLHQQGGSTSTRWYNNGTYGTFGVKLVG